MEREELKKFIDQIKPLNSAAMDRARARQAELAKPPGSLGKLEDISIQLAGITGEMATDVTKQAIAVFSADNGVWEEGVACAPQSVTMAQTINFTRRLTGVGALSWNFGVDLLVTDMGIRELIPTSLYTDKPKEALVDRKIWNKSLGHGTRNLYKEAAMTEEQALTAIATGIEAARAINESCYGIMGIGEMGIGNTTTSSCLLSVFADITPEDTVGKGGGLSDEGFNKKRQVVEEAVARAKQKFGQEGDPIKYLAEIGGFDIAAMAGAYIGAAYYRVPVVIDGYISVVAALTAHRIVEYYQSEKSVNLPDFMISSHQSFERGYMAAIEALGLEPMLNLGMRLGEGSGCPIAFKIVESAVAVMRDMATFEEAAINDDYLEEIRKGDSF